MIKIVVSLLASILTGVQTYLIYTQGKGICFNQGCEIVEQLTAVPPLYFNLAGFLFFQVIFWCFVLGGKGITYLSKFAHLLLLGGLAAEGVLVFFQYSIAETFCSYCLIVCSCIIFLNIICGLKQIFRGTVLFVSVLAACFSLQFDFTGSGGGQPLEAGSLAYVEGVGERPELVLFFSATCTHCEAVIEKMKEESVCAVAFNPIENIESFSFPEAEVKKEYNPAVNLAFLDSLSIREIPVLLARGTDETRIIQGEGKISTYLEEYCRDDSQSEITDYGSGMSSSATGYAPSAAYTVPEDDGCRVDENCPPSPAGTSVIK